MSRLSTGLSTRLFGLGLAIAGGLITVSAAAPAQAAWGLPYLLPPAVVRHTGPDQTWMQDVPERPGAHAKGKVAVFVFRGDDVYEPVRAAVVRALRAKG